MSQHHLFIFFNLFITYKYILTPYIFLINFQPFFSKFIFLINFQKTKNKLCFTFINVDKNKTLVDAKAIPKAVKMTKSQQNFGILTNHYKMSIKMK